MVTSGPQGPDVSHLINSLSERPQPQQQGRAGREFRPRNDQTPIVLREQRLADPDLGMKKILVNKRESRSRRVALVQMRCETCCAACLDEQAYVTSPTRVSGCGMWRVSSVCEFSMG